MRDLRGLRNSSIMNLSRMYRFTIYLRALERGRMPSCTAGIA